MSPVAEVVSDKERTSTTIVGLIRQFDSLKYENEHLAQENIALHSQIAELTETFTLSEVADLLEDFGYVQTDPSLPLSWHLWSCAAQQESWWHGPVLTAIGGEYVKIIAETGVVVTHKGRAFLFDAFLP